MLLVIGSGPLALGAALMIAALPELGILFWIGFTVSLAGAVAAIWLFHYEFKRVSWKMIVGIAVIVLEVVAPFGLLLHAWTLSG